MKPYTIREQNYLRDNHGKKSLTVMAKELGRSRWSVKNHLQRAGLKLDPETAAELKKQAGFKPGQKTAGSTGGKKSTSFKPGNVPHNRKQDGAISAKLHGNGKRYQYIRIADSWELLHKYNWRQAFGPIPAGHVIRFLDGDTMNAQVENLECVTSGENLERNRDRSKAAETRQIRAKAKKWLQKFKKENPDVTQ